MRSVQGKIVWNLEKIFDPDPNLQHIVRYNKNILSIDNISAYEFDESKGLLKLSMSKPDIESMILEMDKLDLSNSLMLLSPPIIFDETPVLVFNYVKSIETLEPINGHYMISYIPEDKVPVNKRGIIHHINIYNKRDNKN